MKVLLSKLTYSEYNFSYASESGNQTYDFAIPSNLNTHLNALRCRFMHLADAFILSDLHCIQSIDQFRHLLGIEPMTLLLLQT